MKMPDVINPALLAPCGMDCLICYAHLKKKKPCRGCLLDDTDKPERCRSCRIKSCARERGLAYCHQCPDYPCRAIRTLDKSYRQRYQTSLIENGRTVAATGLAAFFTAERTRWSCQECGGVVSLHDRECSECGWRPG